MNALTFIKKWQRTVKVAGFENWGQTCTSEKLSTTK